MDAQIRKTRTNFLKLGAAVGAGFAAVITPAALLDRQLRQTLTLTDATGDAFNRLSKQLQKDAMDMAEELSFSATEVAKAFYDVLSTGAQAGTKEFDALAVSALKMGKAVDLTPAESVKALSITVNAFAKSNLTAAQAADTFFTASKLVQTNVPELAEAMKQAGPVASQFGFDIASTTAIISGFAQSGFLGAQAGPAATPAH